MKQEALIQEAVVTHLRTRGVNGVVWWHTPNGAVLANANRFAQMRALKARGFRNGVSDLILVHQERVFALELKAPKGVVSEAQLLFLDDMEKAGAYTCVAQGLDEALRALETWGLLKKEGRGITPDQLTPVLGPITPKIE